MQIDSKPHWPKIKAHVTELTDAGTDQLIFILQRHGGVCGREPCEGKVGTVYDCEWHGCCWKGFPEPGCFQYERKYKET